MSSRGRAVQPQATKVSAPQGRAGRTHPPIMRRSNLCEVNAGIHRLTAPFRSLRSTGHVDGDGVPRQLPQRLMTPAANCCGGSFYQPAVWRVFRDPLVIEMGSVEMTEISTLAALWFDFRMASVTASTVVPTLIANAFYLARPLLPNEVEETAAVKATRPAG